VPAVAVASHPRIRTARAGDLPRLVELESGIFAAPWSESCIAAELTGDPQRVALVCELDERVVGYAFAWHVSDEIHLVSLAVEPSLRRRGLGQLLLSAVLDAPQTREASIVTLEVRAGNDAAQTLYRRNGFVEVALRRAYYPDNREDAVIMLKQLRRAGPRRPRRS
jgi:ribosomal-protein-alanine N-acetyltransferase